MLKKNRSENYIEIPDFLDFKAMAKAPSQVIGLAKFFLLIWVFVWVFGTITRLLSSFKIFRRVTEEEFIDKTIYSIFNFNFTSNNY